MNRDSAILLLDRLHEAQNDFYGGGSETALQRLLTPDVAWIVPGENASPESTVESRRCSATSVAGGPGEGSAQKGASNHLGHATPRRKTVPDRRLIGHRTSNRRRRGLRSR